MNALTRSALAAVILILPVGIEALVGSDRLGLWGHGAFAVSQMIGWWLLFSVSRVLASHAGSSRWGSRLVQAGCALQLVFAVGYGATALAQGEPSEGMFVAFLLGFLALVAGGLTWGVRLVRARRAAPAGTGLVAMAVLGLLAMALGMDPFHDIFLLSSYAAWIAVGLGTERASREQEQPVLVSDGSR